MPQIFKGRSISETGSVGRVSGKCRISVDWGSVTCGVVIDLVVIDFLDGEHAPKQTATASPVASKRK